METQEYRILRDVEDDHWWFRSLHELVVRHLRDAFPAKRPQVLDAGCGTGGLLARLSEIADVEGIDGSDIAVELCAERGIDRVWRDDLNAPSLSPEAYDAITCIDVLYHTGVENDAKALEHLAAALKPGGLLVLHVPAYEWLRSHHDRRVHTRKRYLAREVRQLIEGAGMQVQHESYRMAILLPAIALVRLLSAPFRRAPSDGGDVRRVPALVNLPLLLLCRMENAVSRRIGLPFGSSVYAIGRKPDRPNADSIAYWNEDAGPRWVRHAEMIDVQLEPFLEPLVSRTGVAEGERVLDVGCGAGALSLYLAGRVGTGGSVTGVDVSEGLLDLARRRATERGIEAARFRRADAQVEPFEPGSFDRVVSRFGVMFFEDSMAAFRNLRAALRPGGTLGFVCWAAPQDNPWMGIPRDVVARHIEMPEVPDSTEPGPFRFSDPDYVRTLCEDAGFSDVAVHALEGELILGGTGTLDEALEFLLEVGPGARVQKENDVVRAAVRDDLRRHLSRYSGERGVQMRYRAWLVLATRDQEASR